MKVHVSLGASSPPPPPPPKPEPPAPYKILTVPNDGNTYMQLLDDWDTAQWGYKPRSQAKNYKSDPDWNALPATVQTLKLFYPLNKQWQLFNYDLIRRANGYSLPADMMLEGYRKSFRDSGGWRDQHTYENWREDKANVPRNKQHIYTDHVLGLNVPDEYTMGDAMQQDLLSSGNIVKVIGEGQLLGKPAWVIETLNHTMYDVPTAGASPVNINGRTKYLLDPPTIDDVWGKWWLVGFATSSGYNWTTGAKARLPWAYFGGYGMPLITLGKGGVNRVQKTWCKPIANGAQFSLYV